MVGWLALVLAAALYEGAIAVRWVDLGPLPGAEPAGRSALFRLAMVALLVGGTALLVVGVAAIGRDGYGNPPAFGARLLEMPALSLVPLGAAAFFLAFHFSYDAYGAPNPRRFSASIPTGMLVFVVCGAAIVAAGLRVRLVAGVAAIAGGALIFLIQLGVVLGASH